MEKPIQQQGHETIKKFLSADRYNLFFSLIMGSFLSLNKRSSLYLWTSLFFISLTPYVEIVGYLSLYILDDNWSWYLQLSLLDSSDGQCIRTLVGDSTHEEMEEIFLARQLIVPRLLRAGDVKGSGNVTYNKSQLIIPFVENDSPQSHGRYWVSLLHITFS